MKFRLYFLILFVYVKIVNGKSNFSTFFRTFGGNYSKSKEGCHETVNNCTRLDKSLNNGLCLDLELSHIYTHESAIYNLNVDNWIAIRAIPYCWNYLQILLCSLKYPECIKMTNFWMVKKTTQEICLMTKKECPLLIYKTKDDNMTRDDGNVPFGRYSLFDQTPFFLDCKRYTPKCYSWPYKGSITTKNAMNCTWPMVKTDQQHLWVKGFSGCAYNCKTPIFSEDEYHYTNILFGILGIIFFLLNSFVLLTLTIHKRRYNQYHWHPLLLNMFIFHVYMLISCFGWMLPLVPSIWRSIICRNDGALQIRKPQLRIGESMWCLVSFSIVYFPLLASSITSISFFYSVLSVVKHYASCRLCQDDQIPNSTINFTSSKLPFLSKKIGFSIRKTNGESNIKRQNIELENKKTVIKDNSSPIKGNGLNWEYPISKNQTLSGQLYVILISIALLVISLAIAEIRADPVTGICFLSSEFMITRLCLSVLPLTIFLVVKSVIIYLIIKHLGTIRHHLVIYSNCQEEMHSKRIIRTTRFYVFLILFLWIFWSFSVYTHWYIFNNESSWYKSLKYKFLCHIKQTLSSSTSIFNSGSDSYVCILENKPILNLFILHNCSYFSLNVIYIISSVFNRCTILVWKQKFLEFIHCYKNHKTSPTNSDVNSLYLGLQNKSLLDAVWNPGVFIYLVKKRKKKTEFGKNGIEDKSVATVGSIEDSSASYCIYEQDGSLRSCVSMPPIKSTSRQNNCRFSQDICKDSPMCTTLDDFLNVTQSFVPSNSVRRSHSFGGRLCPISNSCFGYLNIPYSKLQSVSGNQFNSINNRLTQCNNSLHVCNCNCHTSKKNQYSHENNGSSSTQIGGQRNVLSFSDKRRSKYSRRLSLSFDRRNGNGISSRSTLNRRKHSTRYSVSPKSLSKTINNTSSNLSHHDPASCHSSSFSAESYNSYNLMAQQMGGRWRDICRTRMTLHDAMIWAKTASHSAYHSPLSTHTTMCNHQHCCIPNAISAYNYQCSSASNNMFQKPLNQTFSEYDSSQYLEEQEAIPSSTQLCKEIALAKSLKSSKDLETSIPMNDSSDKFNSEDEVESTNNSLKSTDKESGEFCSDDEVVSLLNSDI